jgi:hypothetical protein
LQAILAIVDPYHEFGKSALFQVEITTVQIHLDVCTTALPVGNAGIAAVNISRYPPASAATSPVMSSEAFGGMLIPCKL